MDGAMNAVVASIDPAVAEMSFRPLTSAGDCAELQPMASE